MTQAFGGENADSYYDEGLTASVRGDLERAVACFAKALEMDGGLVAARHQLGRCYHRLGKLDQAAALLHKAALERPDQAGARLDLGFVLVDMGRFDQAQQVFSQIRDAQPQNARACHGLAQVFFEQGDWANAMALGQEARVYGESNFAILFLVGRAAKLAGAEELAEGAMEEANGLLNKLAEMNPERPENHYFLGEIALFLERFATAIEHYQDATDRIGRGEACSAFGQTFTKADVLAKQGVCLQKLKKYERARAMGERVLELDPGHKIGQALAQLDDGDAS